MTPLELTNYWLKSIVIDFDLCPFARKPYEQGMVTIVIKKSVNEDELMQDFFEALDVFNEAGPEHMVTMLVSYPDLQLSFPEFNDLIGEIEEILAENGLDEHFQLVMFHPGFAFEGLPDDSADHYINRSPFPTVQIIRAADLALAGMTPEQAEALSRINGEKFRQLGTENLKKLFYYLSE